MKTQLTTLILLLLICFPLSITAQNHVDGVEPSLLPELEPMYARNIVRVQPVARLGRGYGNKLA